MAAHARAGAVRACALTLAAGVAIAAFDAHYRFFDMVIYHDAIRWWLGGGDLYAYAAPVRGNLGFTYPPVAAVVLLPVALLPATTAGWLFAAGGVLILTAVLAVLLPPATRHSGRPSARMLAAAVTAALCTEPVRQTLGFGQINLLLFALVVGDLIVLRRRNSAWAGIGVGIATALKLTPGLFIVYLLVSGQWRTARTAVVTAAAVTGAGLLAAPETTLHYFGDLLWRTERVGAADAVANQSLAGLLARLADEATAPAHWWVLLSVLALGVGLRRACRAHLDGDEVTAVTVVALTANLVSPISWTHHLVFLPIAVLVLAERFHRDRRPGSGVAALAVYAISVASPIWLVPDGFTGPARFMGENAFTLTLVALVCALPWRSAVCTDAGPTRDAGPRCAVLPDGRAADAMRFVHEHKTRQF